LNSRRGTYILMGGS